MQSSESWVGLYFPHKETASLCIKDFISSKFKFLLSNSEVSSLLLKLQPFRIVKYSVPFYCIWLTDKRSKKGCEEICICLVLGELLHFKLKSRISSAIYVKKLT